MPSTAAPVAATMAAMGPPTREAAATMPAVVFTPDRASGTTGQPPGVWSTSATTGVGAGEVSGGGAAGAVGAASTATCSVLSSVML
ncbi:hypothetical protein ACQSME_00580 [Streptomyces sp. 2-6]|uniref:hypothetical protein n=1 Tax=Streptomyces sp. 2-6 TaxID=2978333 RepID=UPI003D0F8299